MFKGFNSLYLFALQEPKVDLTRGNPSGGVVLQKTICAFRDGASTGLDYISGDKDIPVCMCSLCVGVQCNTQQNLQTDLPCYMYYIVRWVHSRQNICLTTLPKTTPLLPKVFVRVASRNRILAHMTNFYVIVDLGWCRSSTYIQQISSWFQLMCMCVV